jgi:glyoxalase/bleomycin resistance protein/dioxygenase superfamily protein
VIELAFHHLGVACRNLDAEAKILEGLGYRQEGPEFEDPVQGIRGRFLVGPGPRLEILVALGESKVLEPWLRAGVKIYHQAFEVANLEAGLAQLAGQRGKVVVAPVPAVAFGARRICFVMMPNLMLLELIERW